MKKTDKQVPDLLDKLRWVIPAFIAALGVGYTLLEHVLITPHPVNSAHVIREATITGTLGPVLAWMLLTWATKIARSRQQAKEALERRNQELVALNTIGEAASRSLDLDEILQTALHKLVKVLDVEAVEIRTLKGTKLVRKSHYGLSPQFVAGEEIIPLGQCLCGQCAMQGTPVLVNNLDVRSVPRAQPCISEGFHSVLAVPMKVKGQVVGIIHLAGRHAYTFTPHDEQMFTAIGHQIAVAIENARLYAETKRRALQLEIASQVSQKVAAILELDELLAQVVKLIQDKFGYYSVHLLLVDGHSNEVVLRECSGQAGQALKSRGLRLKIGEQGITGRVAQIGQPILCNDVTQEPRYHPHELLLETRSELAIPLRIGDVIVGVLNVQSRERDAFQEDDVTALQILGDQVAIAIENANLFRETQHRFEAMRALHDISLDITSRLDSDRVLAAILRHGAHLLSAQGSVLSIYDPVQDVLRNIAVYNTPPDFQGIILRIGEGVAGQVVATKKPLIVNDYPSWEGHSPHFYNSPFDAVIGVPLQWQGQVIGALVVLDQGDRRPFTESDVHLLSLFADLASIALKKAELYARVIQLSQQLEQKVEQRTNELVKAQEELAKKAEQLQRLLAVMVRVQEEERTRIALDLHDGSNQLITATLYEIQAARRSILGQRETATLKKLETAKGLLRQIETENRRIIFGLHPPILDAHGLAPALKWYVNVCQEHYGIACSVRVSGQPVRLVPEVEIAIYRIIQEALTNVATHAQTREAQVKVDFGPARLRVVVEDNGVGFVPESVLAATSDQMGLIGMRERAQSIGGRIEVHSKPGQGTRIVLDMPLATEPMPEMVLA